YRQAEEEDVEWAKHDLPEGIRHLALDLIAYLTGQLVAAVLDLLVRHLFDFGLRLASLRGHFALPFVLLLGTNACGLDGTAGDQLDEIVARDLGFSVKRREEGLKDQVEDREFAADDPEY